MKISSHVRLCHSAIHIPCFKVFFKTEADCPVEQIVPDRQLRSTLYRISRAAKSNGSKADLYEKIC